MCIVNVQICSTKRKNDFFLRCVNVSIGVSHMGWTFLELFLSLRDFFLLFSLVLGALFEGAGVSNSRNINDKDNIEKKKEKMITC